MFKYILRGVFNMSSFCSIVYFKNKGIENTDETLKLAKERAEDCGIKNVVVASTTGKTGLKASEIFKDYNLVIATPVTGSKEPNIQKFPIDIRTSLERKGVKIVTAAHAFGTLGRSINKKFQVIQIDEIIDTDLGPDDIGGILLSFKTFKSFNFGIFLG